MADPEDEAIEADLMADLGPAYQERPEGVIVAKHKGWCRECRGPIKPGDEIMRAKSGRWEHWRCAP